MNFLQLCQRLREQAGISGSGPGSVLNQSGEMLRVVNWIAYAYEDIQNRHENWEFLQTGFTFNTIINTQNYTIDATGVTELCKWKVDELGDFRSYLAATGTSDEMELQYVEWETFRTLYLFAANRSVTGRPMYFTVKPDKSLSFWPTPNVVYTIDGEYFKRPQVMVANTDEPIIPQQYQMAIVWRALIDYAAYESAPEVYSSAELNFKRIMMKLEIDQLPPIWPGDAMA